MAVQFRAASEDDRGTAGNDLIPTPPAEVHEGDLLLAVQALDKRGSFSEMDTPTPSGWEEIARHSRSDVGYVKVWQRVATADEPDNYHFFHDDGNHASVIVVALHGHNPAEPLAVEPVFASHSADERHPAPSVDGLDGGMLITAHVAGTNGSTRSYSPPNGMTEAQESKLSSGSYILLEVNYQQLRSSAPTGAKAATCSASAPYVTMSLVVRPFGEQWLTPSGIDSGEEFGSPSAAVVPPPVLPSSINSQLAFGSPVVSGGTAADLVVLPIGIPSGEAFPVGPNPGEDLFPGSDTYPGIALGTTVTRDSAGPGPFPGDSLFPSEGIFPGTATAPPRTQVLFPAGIDDSVQAIADHQVPLALTAGITIAPAGGFVARRAFSLDLVFDGTLVGFSTAFVGVPIVTRADGPQFLRVTPIDSIQVVGAPTVTVNDPLYTLVPEPIEDDERFGRPFVMREVPPPVMPVWRDTYFVDGVDLTSYAWRIETAEGLQNTPGVIGEDVMLPLRDGELQVLGALGQPRRSDAPGRITFSMWLKGVDPVTGTLAAEEEDKAEEYFANWDQLVRLFHRRRVVIDHPRPDGTVRRAVAHLLPEESIAPSRLPSSPWFGRFKAVFTIPSAHWTDLSDVSTGKQLLTTGQSLDLSAFAAATAPCTELTVIFGEGNNPRLTTSYNHIGWNDVIQPGRELGINTATGETHQASGDAWTPGYDHLTYAPGPLLFEIDPSEPLEAVFTHTTGGSMSVEVTGKRRYRTS